MTLAKANNLQEEAKTGKFILGEFVEIERPIFAGSTIYEAGC